MISLPFLTSYDPPGSSEGTLDPLGLYQIADQLAIAEIDEKVGEMLQLADQVLELPHNPEKSNQT